MRSMRPIRTLGLILAVFAGLQGTGLAATTDAESACGAPLNHSFNLLLDEKPQSLCQYAGKVVLVVNTASSCGYTYQYEGLEKAWRKYRDQGLVVLGFPANDFGAQERGSNKQIAEFCQVNYGVTFPLFEKMTVPITRHPVFSDLARSTGQAPQWNFHKYLIDRQGKAVSFASGVEPDSPKLAKAIEQALAVR